MKFVKVEIVEADTQVDADAQFADQANLKVWRKTGQIEGEATPARIVDTLNAISLRYKTEKAKAETVK